jgi:hypothetical protein
LIADQVDIGEFDNVTIGMTAARIATVTPK